MVASPNIEAQSSQTPLSLPQNSPYHSDNTAAIEVDSFPFESFYDVAELESWRKEVNRPPYHIHKWWAKRLGSVLRAIIIGSLTPSGTDVADSFYEPARFPGRVIFDPFMGSGTTIGEGLKLGCRTIGRDINPVAYFATKNALASHLHHEVLETFKSIEQDVADQIRAYYEARTPEGDPAETLYYFWVMSANCPNCSHGVELFKSYIFARHVDPQKDKVARALCPSCGSIEATNSNSKALTCTTCQHAFDPSKGPANGKSASCPECEQRFSIIEAIETTGEPPSYRLYAKLILTKEGRKVYLPADEFDFQLYERATVELAEIGDDFLLGEIRPGHNTNQAISYGFLHWRQMYNARQLLCIHMLAERIRSIESTSLRELFTCLLSGALEFNNMFASYKGEGTGAVRHMFSHHIIKPERTPLEANLWGTPKSSGSFSTLFKSRILRALKYCEDPFELATVSENGQRLSKKIYGLSQTIGHETARDFNEFDAGQALYLSCGDSSDTDLADQSVDAVITDPPFFDYVHYSELADFFYAWQRYILGPNQDGPDTTRRDREVQSDDPESFTNRLAGVWLECRRVLKKDGLLVFTFHHSRPEGWGSLLRALNDSGFAIVASHPIKAEMSVGVPKRQAKEPINLDMIMVCRRKEEVKDRVSNIAHVLERATNIAQSQAKRLEDTNHKIGSNDLKVIKSAQAVRFMSVCGEKIQSPENVIKAIVANDANPNPQ